MTNTLRVVAWDDPRCTQPLEAAGVTWKDRTDTEIEITCRPLTEFNDQPLSELAPICDVMIIDYPHMARALEEKAITPIDELISKEAFDEVSANAIGPAQDSFIVDGRHVALSSDAACHVSAHRPDVLAKYGMPVPVTWNDVFALHDDAPGAIALALYPTDAVSCIMSLTAGGGAGPDGGARMFPDEDVAVSAVARLGQLASIVDERCWTSTPQAVHGWALEDETVAYLPLTFGYSRLTAAENGGWHFGAPPQGCGSLLGGAGMAVSSLSPTPEAATNFASWYCGNDGQLLAGRNWGQPAGKAAWDDPIADEMMGGFFTATRSTQETAYVRPRVAWWPKVQDDAGQALVRMLQSGTPPRDIVTGLEKIYATIRPAVGARRTTQAQLPVHEMDLR